jgi:hypothetical protein
VTAQGMWFALNVKAEDFIIFAVNVRGNFSLISIHVLPVALETHLYNIPVAQPSPAQDVEDLVKYPPEKLRNYLSIFCSTGFVYFFQNHPGKNYGLKNKVLKIETKNFIIKRIGYLDLKMNKSVFHVLG